MARNVCIVLAVTLAVATWAAAEEPYKRMFDDTLVFTGTETLPSGTGVDGEIVIGIFAPDDEEHPVGRAITRGATLAVDQANASGGIGGRPIRLVRRWADDPWGAGANEVVKLVFEDHAWALIGGPDGATTHIAQQVVTKAHIPLIAPVSSDPSLTQTRVPWIFRLAPSDRVQASVLVRGALNDSKSKRIGLITATDHDNRAVATELVAALEDRGTPPIFHLEIDPDVADLAATARRAAGFNPDGLILRVPRPSVRSLCEALGAQDLRVPLFLPWIPGSLPGRFTLPYPGEVFWLEPFTPPRSCGTALKLERAYIARYGERPSPSSAYGHDAARIVIDALRTDASGRLELRDAIAGLSKWSGATGPIEWDPGGGNTAIPVIFSRSPRTEGIGKAPR